MLHQRVRPHHTIWLGELKVMEKEEHVHPFMPK